MLDPKVMITCWYFRYSSVEKGSLAVFRSSGLLQTAEPNCAGMLGFLAT
jgi:hypothetical protein